MRTAICLPVVLLVVTLAGAESNPPPPLPAKADWAVHLDAERLIQSEFGAVIREAAARPDVAPKLAAVKVLFGVDLLTDIRAMTLCGDGTNEESFLLFVRGAFDGERLTALVSAANGHAVQDYRGHAIHSWRDQRPGKRLGAAKTRYAAFSNSGLIVFGADERALKEALDVIDGRAAASDLGRAIGSTDTFLAGIAKGVDRAATAAPRATFLEHVESLELSARDAGERVRLALSATAEDAETATRMRLVIEGLRALVLLDAERRPAAAALVENAEITQNGRRVGVSILVSREMLRELEEARRAKR